MQSRVGEEKKTHIYAVNAEWSLTQHFLITHNLKATLQLKETRLAYKVIGQCLVLFWFFFHVKKRGFYASSYCTLPDVLTPFQRLK